jgi:tRNA dimethylallyltransferase
MGPTSAGKTDSAIRLAETIPCEIVNVDSAMVYKGLDIGTAKPTRAERAFVKHHLIDITEPCSPYSAAKFIKDASFSIHAILNTGKLPVLVGGTMLYYKALQQGLSPLPAANEMLRNQLTHEANRIGWQKMHARLALIDPISAQHIHSTDSQRIQRALEVYELTGQPLSVLWQEKENPGASFDYINIAIAPHDRAIMHKRIAERFHNMLKIGFIEEVEQLRAQYDLHLNLPAIRSVGYRQIWHYLEGNMSHQEMCDAAIAATRQLAKRQLTWLRNWQWQPITWFDTLAVHGYQNLYYYIETFLTKCRQTL